MIEQPPIRFVPGQRYLSRTGRSFRLLGLFLSQAQGWILEWAIEYEHYDMSTCTQLDGHHYAPKDEKIYGTEHEDDVVSDVPYTGPRGVGHSKYDGTCMMISFPPLPSE
jgi:hypothetical protein